MGGDGGSIPKRCELVQNRQKREKFDRNIELALKWRTCQLSQEPLKKPIVACKLGRLYNKEAILESMLGKTLNVNEVTRHIRSLADVKELRLTANKAYKDTGPDMGDTFIDFNETPFVCPVTSIAMNGINAFFVNWICGCAVSEKAIQEVPITSCHGCGGPVDKEKLLKLYPEEELFEVYRKRVEEEMAQKELQKAQKDIQKAKKNNLKQAKKRELLEAANDKAADEDNELSQLKKSKKDKAIVAQELSLQI